MIEHKANGQEFLIVEVSDGVKYWNICIYPRLGTWIVGETDKPVLNAPKVQIPSGTYTILFTAEEAAEEQAAMVVHSKYPISELQKVIDTYFTDTSKKHLILKKHS